MTKIVTLITKIVIINPWHFPLMNRFYKVKATDFHPIYKGIEIAYIEDFETKIGYIISIKGLRTIKYEFITEEEMKI